MKKLYIFILGLGTTVAAQAQFDISVALDEYTNMEATSDDPLDLSFTVTNAGITIPSGDSIYWAITDGSSYWTTDDLTEGYVMYTVLAADFTNGQSFSIAAAPIDMAWFYDNIGLSGNLCIAILGVNANAATPPNMLTPANDFSCVAYTVTEVAGLEGVGTNYLTVYPNPATDLINFQVGNNGVSHINVYDLTGKFVTTVNVNGSIETITTENFGAGVFYYQMMNGEEMIATDRFVVTK